MKRRDALKHSAAIFTVTGIIPGIVLQTSCSPETKEWLSSSFDELQGKNLKSAIDVLIPRSSAPSATDVKVHEFIDSMLYTIYSEEHKNEFLDVLNRLNELALEKSGNDYYKLDDEEKNQVMLAFREDEAGERAGSQYRDLRNLTLRGYVRTEEVCTKVLRHVSVPGRYDGCVPLEPGQPVWAE